MEIVSRTENKLLNRVEIEFRWSHKGKETPSKKEVMDLVKTLEPGSNPDLIVVKDCKTRYGQAPEVMKQVYLPQIYLQCMINYQ